MRTVTVIRETLLKLLQSCNKFYVLMLRFVETVLERGAFKCMPKLGVFVSLFNCITLFRNMYLSFSPQSEQIFYSILSIVIPNFQGR